jgi:ParB-like chromosome segregation protein Spo0J
MFGDVSDSELRALAEDMRVHKQKDPVEILPDGTVLAGHQRIRAARLLGWMEVDVVIRYDLAEAGAAAQEKYIIVNNLVRRHLSPLGRARCIRHLLEIEAKKRPGGLDGRRKEDVKKELVERLNLSLRSVNRYLLVLEALPEVQNAFDHGELSLINAGKVALLRQSVQDEIAQRIRSGEQAGRVVAECLAAWDACTGNVNRFLERMLAVIRRETPRLRGRLDELGAGLLSTVVPELQEARALLAQVIAWAKRVRRLDARRPPPANALRAAACRTARPGPGTRDPQTGWGPPSPAGG